MAFEHLMDSIKTYKSGAWQRAVVHKWNGYAWEVCEVYSSNSTQKMNNLNATAKVKTYTPTWIARYNHDTSTVDKASTNMATIFESGGNYNGTGNNYGLFIGLPYSTIVTDYQNTFGIAFIEITYTISAMNSGYGFGFSELYPHSFTSMPSVGSYQSTSYSYKGDFYAYTSNLTEENSDSSNVARMIMEIGQGQYNGIFLGADLYRSVWYSLSNMKFKVTWAGK